MGYICPTPEGLKSMGLSAMALSSGLTILSGLISSETTSKRIDRATNAYSKSIKDNGFVQSVAKALQSFVGQDSKSLIPEIGKMVNQHKFNMQNRKVHGDLEEHKKMDNSIRKAMKPKGKKGGTKMSKNTKANKPVWDEEQDLDKVIYKERKAKQASDAAAEKSNYEVDRAIANGYKI
jgi:hypothetical protein